jgi:hypothetical protein
MPGINTHNLPSLASYRQCEEWFEKTKKPRSLRWEDYERPLESARMLHKMLRRNAWSDSYQLVLYDTVLVEHWFENFVTFVRIDNRQGSRGFMNRFLPPGVQAFSHQGYTYLSVPTPAGRHFVTQQGSERISLIPAEGNTYTIEGAEKRKREFIDRSRLAQVAHIWDEFSEWCKAATRVQGGAPGDVNDALRVPRLTDRAVWPELLLAWQIWPDRKAFEFFIRARYTEEIDPCLYPKKSRLGFLS